MPNYETSTIAKKTAEAYDAWSEVYDTCENPTRDLDEKVLMAQEFNLGNGRGANVVEVCCGTGRHSEKLMGAKGGDVSSYLAMDISSGMLGMAKERIANSTQLPKEWQSKVSFVQHDITTPWPCKTNSADLVFENLALEHLKCVDFFFSEAQRVLKPGAILFISEYHPYKRYKREEVCDPWSVRLKSSDGSRDIIADPPCFTHNVSKLMDSAMTNGFRVKSFREWHDDDDDESKLPPRILSIHFVKEM